MERSEKGGKEYIDNEIRIVKRLECKSNGLECQRNGRACSELKWNKRARRMLRQYNGREEMKRKRKTKQCRVKKVRKNKTGKEGSETRWKWIKGNQNEKNKRENIQWQFKGKEKESNKVRKLENRSTEITTRKI